MKKTKFYIGLLWRPVLLVGLSLSILLGLFLYNLQGHVSYSVTEISQYQKIRTFDDVVRWPLSAPLSGIQYLAQRTEANPLIALRVVSAGFAVIGVLCLFLVARSWHTTRVAILSSTMFATSSGFLLYGRLGTADILLTCVSSLFLMRIWLGTTKKRKLTVLVSIIFGAVALYTPGGLWLLLCGIIWRYKKLTQEARSVPLWYFCLALLIGLVCISPLIFASLQNIQILAATLGLPPEKLSLADYGQNILNIAETLVYRADYTTEFTFGRSALLDAFSITTCAIGIYAYAKRVKLDRSKLLLAGSLLSIILISLGGLVSIALLLPFIYLFIASGIAWLLQQWFVVFPKNPVARSVGLSLMIVAVGLSVSYNAFRYYVAWPHIAKTAEVYNQRQ